MAKKKSPKEASKLFYDILKASVSGNPAPKPKNEKKYSAKYEKEVESLKTGIAYLTSQLKSSKKRLKYIESGEADKHDEETKHKGPIPKYV